MLRKGDEGGVEAPTAPQCAGVRKTYRGGHKHTQKKQSRKRQRKRKVTRIVPNEISKRYAPLCIFLGRSCQSKMLQPLAFLPQAHSFLKPILLFALEVLTTQLFFNRTHMPPIQKPKVATKASAICQWQAGTASTPCQTTATVPSRKPVHMRRRAQDTMLAKQEKDRRKSLRLECWEAN